MTEPAQISRWWSDTAEIDVRPGGEGALSRADHGSVQLRVEAVERPHRFSFRWVYPEGAEPREGNSMLVELILTPEGENTRLRVVESGMRELDWPEEQKTTYVGEHVDGWKRHLDDLLAYVAQQLQVAPRR